MYTKHDLEYLFYLRRIKITFKKMTQEIIIEEDAYYSHLGDHTIIYNLIDKSCGKPHT
jgi:hypothetical protein